MDSKKSVKSVGILVNHKGVNSQGGAGNDLVCYSTFVGRG